MKIDIKNETTENLSLQYDFWQNKLLENDELRRLLENAPLEESTRMLKFLVLFSVAADHSNIFRNILNN